jgi:hypothetical protein
MKISKFLMETLFSLDRYDDNDKIVFKCFILTSSMVSQFDNMEFDKKQLYCIVCIVLLKFTDQARNA